MAYIGYDGKLSNIQKLDTITFDSVTTTFATRVGGSLISIGSAAGALISIGGVIYEPYTDYNFAGSNIIFTVAPVTGLSFFGIALGRSIEIGVPSDGTITNTKFAQAVSIANGGTGATTADNALAALGGAAAGIAVFKSASASTARTQLGLGNAATLDAGTSTGNLVQLTTGNKLPAVDGSLLTGLSSGFSNIAVITASTTWTIPAGVTKLKLTVVGAGGGGASSSASGNQNVGGCGGGAGAAAIKILTPVTPGNTLVLTVGGGGGAGGTGGTSSVASGTQTISTITATGGGGGSTNNGGSGGTATGGNLNISGGGGGAGTVSFSTNNANGSGGNGGASIFGSGGAGINGSGHGAAGSAYGSGGGSANGNATTGGSGASGVIIIEY